MPTSFPFDLDRHEPSTPAVAMSAPAASGDGSDAEAGRPSGDEPGAAANQRQSGSAAATAVRPAPAKPTPDVLPPWRVILHNDDDNSIDYVVDTIVRVARLNRPSATRCTVEAHRKGCGQIVATHRERAEFLAEQLRSCKLVVTIEPVR